MRPLKTLPALLLPIILLFSWFPCPALASRPLDGNALERAWKQYMAAKTHSRPAFKFPFEACFQKAAQQYELPVSLLLAVARGESDFNPKAKSDKDCYGVMQIRWPITAKHLGITTLEALGDPCTNITAGAKYIREMLDRYAGNLHLALAAYNYGPGRISQKASPALIPKGAQWYSGYIHHHLEYILGQTPGETEPSQAERLAYGAERKLPIITFNKPYRAMGFYDYARAKAPSLRIDWFKKGLGRFQVVLLYRDKAELKRGKEALKRLGLNG